MEIAKTFPVIVIVALFMDSLIFQGAAKSLGGSSNSRNGQGTGTTVQVHKLKSTADVTINSGTNLNQHDYVAMGRMPRHTLSRALLQFQAIPESCKYVAKAEMFVYYYRAYLWHRYRMPFSPKTVEVRQVLSDWKEGEATWTNSNAGKQWGKPGLGLNNTDAAEMPEEDTHTVTQHTESNFLKFDVTSVAQRWTAGDQDFGFLLSLATESTFGREIHLFSHEAKDKNGINVKPYMKVTCWSDFCAPTAQRRRGQIDGKKGQEIAPEENPMRGGGSREAETGRRESQITSGNTTFNVPANTYHHK